MQSRKGFFGFFLLWFWGFVALAFIGGIALLEAIL
jgi:hypothetical protein